MGRLADAEPLYRKGLMILRKGPPKFGGYLCSFGKLLQDMGRLQDAELLLRESLEMRRNDPALGPEHPKVKESEEILHALLRTLGRSEGAEGAL